MNKKDILGIFEYVSTVDTKCAYELTYAITLLHGCINKSLDVVKDQIVDATANNHFDELAKLGEYCKGIQELQQQIIDCNMAIKILEEKNVISTAFEPVTVTPKKEEVQHNEHIDYSKYAVDDMVMHSLDEDFVYSRISKIGIFGKVYKVDSWKTALLMLCEILYKKNPAMFKSFINDTEMNGEKCEYFSYTEYYTKDGVPRNKKLKGTDIYIWTNNNANGIVRLIKKIINRYGIKEKDVVVFLRADYKDLHR